MAQQENIAMSTMTEVPTMAIAQEASKLLRQIFGKSMKNAILFGSCARGDDDAESDIDIALLLDMKRADIKNWHDDIIALATTLSLKYGRLLSVIGIPAADFAAYQEDLPFYSNIAKEGVVLSA